LKRRKAKLSARRRAALERVHRRRLANEKRRVLRRQQLRARRNPAERPSDVKRAIRLFERFTGHPGERIAKVVKPKIPNVGIAVGKVLGVAYETVRDGRRERYFHRFASHARPLLVASHDGRTVFMLGGAYTFTDRGIVDRPR